VIPAKAATARNYEVLLNALKKHTTVRADHKNIMMQMVTDSSRKVTITPKTLYRNVMPDVTGMGLKDAVYMLENIGLHVQVSGKGKVSGQSVTPGTRITKGQNIILLLS